jgi:hypothetical protein
MRTLVVVAVLVATAACGAYQFPGGNPSSSPGPGEGTVSGRVLAVPCAPVERAGSECLGRPVPKLELDYIKDGAVAVRTVTDSDSSYLVSLPAGTYEVNLKSYMRVISGPLTIAVAPGSSQVANYLLDSGIRAPVPQPPLPQQ